MRSDYIVSLIKAHCENNEKEFREMVHLIADTEQKKGNTTVSKKILNIYNKKTPKKNTFREEKEDFYPSSGLVMFEPSTIVAPKEKSNNYNLFDLIYPENIEKQDIIYSQQVEEKLEEIIKEYRLKENLLQLGLPYENRLLLCGPPGCGKTSTAYFLAKRLDIPLAYIRLDALVSSLLGQTGTNIRKIFDAVNGKNVLLFLDEFDAIAKRRDDKQELGELKRVVNTLLQNIDLLSQDVFVIAATNHEKLLDPAVWRRFNSALLLDLPDSEMRKNYLTNRLNCYNLEIEVDIEKISKITKGMNFSQLNEMILKTLKKKVIYNSESLSTKDFIQTITSMTLLYNNDNPEVITELIKKLRKAGMTIRDIAEITSIPRSTISDKLKEGKENER
ncbi:ATP-binding protein [Bacillus cereus group sp. BfR-BA-01380]|uniref:AAA family ATPase n=1 Tax=Bacillus cereus group sp. BfR-BA-01380 TaxID=2920324 RepID=UPI001F592C8F|nr:ATP-binding protein [Bacillus cereus group sp. BfR-BA-01380]